MLILTFSKDAPKIFENVCLATTDLGMFQAVLAERTAMLFFHSLLHSQKMSYSSFS
jgi:hypothetical protein